MRVTDTKRQAKGIVDRVKFKLSSSRKKVGSKRRQRTSTLQKKQAIKNGANADTTGCVGLDGFPEFDDYPAEAIYEDDLEDLTSQIVLNSSTEKQAEEQKADIMLTDVRIGVLGCGQYQCAIAQIFSRAGFKVSLLLKEPDVERDISIHGVAVVSLEFGLAESDLVLLAEPFPKDAVSKTDLAAGIILVDCISRNTSNSSNATFDMSYSEFLAFTYSSAIIVKAFSSATTETIQSAYKSFNNQVYIASDSKEARNLVGKIFKKAGFVPVDNGTLAASRTLEATGASLYSNWIVPVLVNGLLFLFFYLLSILHNQVCCDEYTSWSDPTYGNFTDEPNLSVTKWYSLPMHNVNKTLAVLSLVTLSLSYLPGVIAAWIQIFRATKYSRFPSWLDSWLKMRKQLGLMMLFTVSIHVLLSVSYNNKELAWPAKTSLLPIIDIDSNLEVEASLTQLELVNLSQTDKMQWRGECFLITGAIGLGLLILLGLSSLPGVSGQLNWKEFAFIQSGLGWTALISSVGHAVFYNWEHILSTSCGFIPTEYQYCLYLPLLTALLKLPLVVPPLKTRLEKIRAGYVMTNNKA